LSNTNNLAKPEKDRTGVFAGQSDFVVTEEVGEALLEWANADEESK
jgi:hypothetical protein